MARYFAEIDNDNIVLRVIVCDDPEWPEQRLGGTWVETADPYVEAGDVAYTGPGHGYDPDWPVRFASVWVQPVAISEPEEGEEPWTWYKTGDVAFHDGNLWVSTMDENVWEPGVSGWRRTPTTPGVPPIWTAPTGAHDTWTQGEHVMHNDVEYISLVSDNVWEPGTDDTLWVVAGEEPATPPSEEPTIEPWVQPTGGHDTYNAGAVVTHNGQTWVNIHGDGNSWEPGVFGWEVQ